MITFLRKFRLLFSQTNTVGKYLSYAIGEILLVVIGILIALQVNNWNENRKNQASEQKMLHSLLQEFDGNLRELEQTMALNERNISRGLNLGEYTGPALPSSDENQLSQLMVDVFKQEPIFSPSQGSISEIINSGRLSILTDPELRKAISAWQSELERVKKQEDFVVHRRDLAHEFFLKNGNFRRHLHIIDESMLKVSPSRFPPNQFKFLQSQEFESQLFLFIVASKNLNINFYQPLKTKIEQMCAMIRKDIKH